MEMTTDFSHPVSKVIYSKKVYQFATSLLIARVENSISTHTRQNKVKEVEHESYVEKNTAKQKDVLPRFVNPI